MVLVRLRSLRCAILSYILYYGSRFIRVNIQKYDKIYSDLRRHLAYKGSLKTPQVALLKKTHRAGNMNEIFKSVKVFNKGDVGKAIIVNDHVRNHSNRFKLDKYKF